MKFDKLVRDNIPAIIRKDGHNPITHTVKDKEYATALTSKLHEEVKEFLDNPSVEEAADILEVIHAICDQKNVDLRSLEDVRQKKADERGRFSQGIILDRID